MQEGVEQVKGMVDKERSSLNKELQELVQRHDALRRELAQDPRNIEANELRQKILAIESKLKALDRVEVKPKKQPVCSG